MNSTSELPSRHKSLPTSLEEHEHFVRKTIGSVGARGDIEKAAVYSRVSNIDQHSCSYSMEYQPDRAEEYVNSRGWENEP